MNTNNIEDQYWLSHNRIPGPAYVRADYDSGLPVQHIQVSIVLDCEARYDFSAVRVLCLCNNSDFLRNVKIQECPDPGSGYQFTHRSRLHKKLNMESADPSTAICTVVFEVSEYSDGEHFNLEATFQPSRASPSRRVLYDCLYPLNFSNPSAFFLLHVSKPISFPGTLATGPAYSVRILPLPSKRRTPLVVLPPNIIRHIVYLATLGSKEWRQELLSYALVCKAWEHVLELFFEGLHITRAVDTGHILRSLRWRPQYGASIRDLDYRKFASGYPHLSRWPAFLEILKYAKHTRRLCIPYLPRLLVAEAVPVVCEMHKVREGVFGYGAASPAPGDSMNMADIQHVISKWEDLKDLSVEGWGDARGHDSEYKIPQHLGSRIQKLNLSQGCLTASQLLHFASPTGCNLGQICFRSIWGPSNSEFQRFLSVVAPTLGELEVYDCDFPRLDGEERALDAVMPQMKSLRYLWATSHFVSTLSLIRKPDIPEPQPSTKNRYQRNAIIIACDDSSINITDVHSAIQVTEWKLVMLKRAPAWNPLLVAKVQDAAQCRGVDVVIDYAR